MQRACDACGQGYEAKRPSSRFCSDRCRKRAKRSGLEAPVPATQPAQTPADAPLAGVLASVTEALTAGGVLESPAGQLAVALATRLDTPGVDTGSAVAAVSRELRAVLAEALGVATVAADPVDELRERRERRNAG